MILVDSSVWIDHFRGKENSLRVHLEREEVLMHPFVMGEIACGNLKNRNYVLAMMANLPSAVTATDREALEFIEQRSLYGRGLGYIDIHLLAATALTPDALMWSLDSRLQRVAEEMEMAHE
jgi:hypothetical protein